MGKDPFKLQPDGSALYDLGNGLFIYTPANNGAKDPATGQEIDQPVIVDASGNPVPGYSADQARAIESQYEGKGATYGTSTPGTGAPLNAEGNAAGGFVLGAGAGFLYGGPAGAAVGAGLGAADGYKAGSNGTTIANQIAGGVDTAYNALPGGKPPAAPAPAGAVSGTLSSDEQAARDYAKQLQDQANARAANPTTAPQISPIPGATATHATAGQVDINSGPTAAPVTGYTGAPIVAPKEATVTPATAGGFSVGSIGAGSVAAGSIDTTKNLIDLNSDSRAQQQAAVDLARGAAMGTAPSQAEELYKQAIQQGAAAQIGGAATLQGRNPAAALRAGLAGAAGVNLSSAAQMAGMRADEMAQARRDFLTGTSSLRSTDVDVQKANQNTVLQGSMANLSADTQAKIASLQAATQTAVANLNAQVAAGQSNLAAQTQIQVANLQAQMQQAHDDAYNELQARINNGQISEDAWKAQMQANTDLTKTEINAQWNALIQNSINTTNVSTNAATNDTNVSLGNQRASVDVATANLNAQTATAQLDDAFQLGKGTQIIAALGLPLGASEKDIENQIAAHAGDQAYMAKIYQIIGTYLAA